MPSEPVQIVAENVYTTIIGELSDQTHAALRKELAYESPSAAWTASFKEEQWDGLITLYQKRYQRFPTGLTSRVIALFKRLFIPYTFTDKRKRPTDNYKPYETAFADLGWEIRPYQELTVKSAAKGTRGILAVCTGGGKTVISCELIRSMAVAPVVFIVPGKTLLHQTHKVFEDFLRLDGKPIKVGKIGDGNYDIVPDGINLVTYQTALIAFNEKYDIATNKIQKDQLAGERVKKPLKQLQKEYEVAKATFKAASAQFEKNHAKQINEVADSANALVDKLEKETRKSYRDALEREHRKKARELDRFFNKEVEVFKTARDKAKTTLATRLQSMENKAKLRALFESAAAFVVDEAHTAAVVIETLAEHAVNAFYKIGLTATPFREDNQEIRIEGAMGRKLIEISASDLTELGFLVPAHIFAIRNTYVEESESYEDAYKKHIINCWDRNYRIKQCAEALKEAGIPTLILVEREDHGDILESMIKDSVFVMGGDKSGGYDEEVTDEEKDYRRRMLNATERNDIILIATQWANVGVDAPKIQGLILAGSCQSAVTTYQQVGRVLRGAPGKFFAVIIDFIDEQKHLHNHSTRRLRVYRRERAWKVKRLRGI